MAMEMGRSLGNRSSYLGSDDGDGAVPNGTRGRFTGMPGGPAGLSKGPIQGHAGIDRESGQGLFRQPGQWRERVEEMARRFREKGATSPEKAMTPQELGLPPRFEEAMKRRLGQTGIFVEVGGKYYLNEYRLREIEQEGQGMGPGRGGMMGARRNLATLRIVRMVLGVVVISLMFVNVFLGGNPLLWAVLGVLVLVWIGVSIWQIIYLSRARGRYQGPPT
jgi:hypothetical protein